MIRSSTQTLAVALVTLGLILRLAFATTNALWLDLPHLDEFHLVATLFAAGQETFDFRIGWTYAYVLGFLYAITGPHEIVGYVASALAWTAAALTLDAILKLLGAAPRARLAALAVFALMPSSLYYGSSIMRDVYQLLFVNLMLLGALRIGIARDYGAAVPMVLAGAALCLLHGGLMAWTIVVCIATLGWVLVLHRSREPRQALAAIVILSFVVFAAAMFVRFGYNLADGLDAAVAGYHDRITADGRPRTEFRLFTDLVAAGGPLSIVAGLVRYMFEPMPWHAQNIGDLGVFGENVIRLVLLGMALWALLTDRARRVPILLLLFAWCCLEGIWSLGTIAWGTAIRHHLPGSGLLVAAAFASFRFERRATPFRTPA